MKYAMLSAATAALFSSASAVSTIAVVNNCAIDLYLWSVAGGEAPSQMFRLPGGNPKIGYSEKYRYVSEYAGVSLKVAPYYLKGGVLPPPFMNVTQLEYTVPDPAKGDPNIWYDLSMVNGNAFMGIPFTYSPSSPMAPNCVTGSCSGDYELCTAGYNFPTDDSHTHACPFEQDIIFTFCDGNPQHPILAPLGEVSCGGSSCSAVAKREVEPESMPEPQAAAEADPEAVCYSALDADTAAGVPIIAALCPNAASTTTASSSSSSSSSSTLTTPTTTAAAAPSAVAALQQPAPQASTTSSSSAAPVATQAAAPASGPTSPLSALQLSSLANTGVTCWQSVEGGETCGVTIVETRSVPEKRSVHMHSHLHNHQAFHRRNRIIRSASA